MNTFELVSQYKLAWDNLEILQLDNCLHENFEYGSQMVLTNIYGKENYLEYIKAKFLTIKNSGDNIVAQIGKFNDQYCLLITQKEKTIITSQTITRKGILLLEFNGGLISKAHMCSIAPTEHDIEILL